MTSKEALEEIKKFKIVVDGIKFPIITEYYAEQVSIIEKDLEVLKILKKHIYFSSKSGCIRMKDIYTYIRTGKNHWEDVYAVIGEEVVDTEEWYKKAKLKQ